MKSRESSRVFSIILVTAVICLEGVVAMAQGSLFPSNAPAPTMKTLQEIWDKIAVQQSQIESLKLQNGAMLNALGANLPWQLTYVYTNDLAGTSPSLAFGPDWKPGIAFGQGFFGVTNKLYYSHFTGSAWTTEVADATDDTGWYPSLAFSPAGNPVICHVGFSANILRLTSLYNNSWSNLTVDSGSEYLKPSLAFGPDGNPAISYYDFTNGKLKFARFNGTLWSNEVLDSVAYGFESATTLKFGPNGFPVISYHDQAAGSLKLAVFNGSAWIISTVAFPSAGKGSSMALSRSGQPSVSYWDGLVNELIFGEYNGSTWNFTTVDTDTGVLGAIRTSLGFNLAGQPVIAYWHPSTFSVKYAEYNGASWIKSTIDVLPSSAVFPSLAISPGGEAAMAYPWSDDLKFARRGLASPAP